MNQNEPFQRLHRQTLVDLAQKRSYMKPPQTTDNRSGFTLVELIVVLMILVGLAAILIPAVTDMVARTNASSASSNVSEVANAIQRYETQFLTYPNNMDSLMSNLGLGTDLDTLSAPLTAATADVTLTAALRAPLTAAGITSVGVHTAGDNTFQIPTATGLNDDDIVKGLTAAAQQALGLEATGVLNKYVIFGIGSLAAINGQTSIDAPVYFPEEGTFNPEAIYGRYIAVFQITDGTDPLSRAKLAAVITPTAEGLSTAMANYFDVTSMN